jgi:surface antigen
MPSSRPTIFFCCVALAFTAVAPSPALANPAGTAHSTPNYGVSGVSFQCGAAQNYSCTAGGYNGGAAAGSGWPWSLYGGQWASYVGNDPHNCTLYAAFRVHENGVGNPGWSDNANGWANKAWSHGTPVDQSPAPGAIAQWNVPGAFGHVAYVDSVDSGGAGITITEDNYIDNSSRYYPGGFTARVHISAGSPAWPDNFIHFADQGSVGPPTPPPPPKDGDFVVNNGAVYRLAGGAPIYVSTWNNVGGQQATTTLDDGAFAALRQFPTDGTLLNGSGGGVFVVAGGAPLYLSNYAAIGGSRGGIGVDQAAIDNAGGGTVWGHLRAVPSDGTILDASGGGVFVVAGGAPLYVSNWGNIGGMRGGVLVDQWDIDNASNPAAHLRMLPLDGTAINSVLTGTVYVIAGGAPIAVSSWDAIGGARPSVGVDQWDLDNLTNPAAHLRKLPADGTLLNTIAGPVYVVAGGAPIFVSSWDAIGGQKPATTVDPWAINNIGNAVVHLNAVPAEGTVLLPGAEAYVVAGGAPLFVHDWAAVGGARPGVIIDPWVLANTANPAAHLLSVPRDGTFLASAAGHFARIAGGAPFTVSDWTLFGGPKPFVIVDDWNFNHLQDPRAHLHKVPADGTHVEALPSKQHWSFHGGERFEANSIPDQTSVEDESLSLYPRYSNGQPLGVPVEENLPTMGCSNAGPAPLWSLAFALLALAVRRRPGKERAGSSA